MQRKLNPNPYSNLTALLDTTRKLDPREMAELQLELGYVDRALAIFERLLLAEPRNDYYRRRCEWLARLAMSEERRARAPSEPRRRTRTRRGNPHEPTPTVIRPIRPVRIVEVK